VAGVGESEEWEVSILARFRGGSELSTEDAKLEQDLKILAAMAAEMEEYLRSDVLFWQMMPGGMPKLTLGGYLMRQHRLLALRDLLDKAQRARLDAAVTQFNRALVEKVVRFEQRAHRELAARVRQWSEYLRDLEQDSGSSAANYNSAVETRAMMAALVDKLKTPPYQLEPRLRQQVELLDRNLRLRWKPGQFVWPELWQTAYPRTAYWWLYGQPG
jgi:hypothetical protein